MPDTVRPRIQVPPVSAVDPSMVKHRLSGDWHDEARDMLPTPDVSRRDDGKAARQTPASAPPSDSRAARAAACQCTESEIRLAIENKFHASDDSGSRVLYARDTAYRHSEPSSQTRTLAYQNVLGLEGVRTPSGPSASTRTVATQFDEGNLLAEEIAALPAAERTLARLVAARLVPADHRPFPPAFVESLRSDWAIDKLIKLRTPEAARLFVSTPSEHDQGAYFQALSFIDYVKPGTVCQDLLDAARKAKNLDAVAAMLTPNRFSGLAQPHHSLVTSTDQADEEKRVVAFQRDLDAAIRANHAEASAALARSPYAADFFKQHPNLVASAWARNKFEAVAGLIRGGAPVGELDDKDGLRPLAYAVAFGSTALVSALCMPRHAPQKDTANEDERARELNGALHLAVKNHAWRKADALLTCGADPNAPSEIDGVRARPAYYIVEGSRGDPQGARGRLDMLGSLIAHGMDPGKPVYGRRRIGDFFGRSDAVHAEMRKMCDAATEKIEASWSPLARGWSRLRRAASRGVQAVKHGLLSVVRKIAYVARLGHPERPSQAR